MWAERYRSTTYIKIAQTTKRNRKRYEPLHAHEHIAHIRCVGQLAAPTKELVIMEMYLVDMCLLCHCYGGKGLLILCTGILSSAMAK